MDFMANVKTAAKKEFPLAAKASKLHPYVTRMLGETHAQEYVRAVKHFIDEQSLNEMFETLEKSSYDHFDPDDPEDTKRRRVEERAGRTGHVSEWDEQRWGQWFENQGLSEFVMEGRPAFMKISDAFNSKDNDRLNNVIKALRTFCHNNNISNEKAEVAQSYLRDIFEPKVNHWTDLDDYRIRLKKYFGSGRLTERRTFDHFHKSFPLSPVPPHLFQEEDVNKRPKQLEDYYQPGLYLPHPQKWLPDWGHRKQIASVYGPQYLNYASMPLPKMPTPEEIQEKRLERQRERAYRKRGELLKKRLKKRAENMAKQKFELTLHDEKVQVSKLSAIAASSVQDEYSGSKVTFVGPRRAQVFDPNTFRGMKGPGDPQLPTEFKDMIFENYLSTIDKNNSLPAWKKIYAMHLIPRAFGGPEGDFLDEIDEEPELLTKVDDTLFEGAGEVVTSSEDDGVGDLGL